MCRELESKRIGLDVDGVLSNFAQGIIDRAKIEGLSHLFPASSEEVCTWDICKNPKDFLDLFLRIQNEESFWLGLPPLPDAQLFFTEHPKVRPEMYITKRPVRNNVTARWLNLNGFPPAEVITVDDPAAKVSLVKGRCDLYIDDLVATIRQMREAGVNGLLYKAPYQRGEDISELPILESFFDLCSGSDSLRGV